MPMTTIRTSIKVTGILVLLLFSSKVLAAEQAFWDYLNGVNYGVIRPPSIHGVEDHIFNYQPEYFYDLLTLARGKSKEGRMDGAVTILGDVAEYEPRFKYETIRSLVEAVEVDAYKDPEWISSLSSIYSLLGRSGSPEALRFLQQRASFEYWKNRTMPVLKEEFGEDRVPETITPQEQALYAIAWHPSPEAQKFLEACQKDPRYQDNRRLALAIKFALETRPLAHQIYETVQNAWAERGLLPALSPEEMAAANAQIQTILGTGPPSNLVGPSPYPELKHETPPPEFPLVAKIGIPIVVLMVVWWLWFEWKRR